MHLVLKSCTQLYFSFTNISIHLIILHPPRKTITITRYIIDTNIFNISSLSILRQKKKKKNITINTLLQFPATWHTQSTPYHAPNKRSNTISQLPLFDQHAKRYEDTANPFKREQRVNVGEQLSKRQNTLVHKGGIKHPASNHDPANRSRSIRFEGND